MDRFLLDDRFFLSRIDPYFHRWKISEDEVTAWGILHNRPIRLEFTREESEEIGSFSSLRIKMMFGTEVLQKKFTLSESDDCQLLQSESDPNLFILSSFDLDVADLEDRILCWFASLT